MTEQIDNIMDNFSFGRVHEIMKASGWTWGDIVPTEPELRKEARRLLRVVAVDGAQLAGTGGFTAMRFEDRLLLVWGVDSLEFFTG